MVFRFTSRLLCGMSVAGVAVCLTTDSALAQCNPFISCAAEWSHGQVIDLGGLPGPTSSGAASINNTGQAVGYSIAGGGELATEWSHGHVIDLGGLPGATFSGAASINDAGQAVGVSLGGTEFATEWSH